MPSTPVRTCTPQSFDVRQYLPSQVVLDLHAVQRSVELENLWRGELLDAHSVMEMEARKET